LIHREVLEEIEHDEEYGGNGYREETDFHVKAAKHGFRLVFCPHTVCFHLPRIEGSGQWSMSRITYEYWTIKNNNYFLRKHYPFLKERLQLNENVYRMAVRFSYHRIRRYIGLKVTELARMRT
jgi:GT2 family glycosyltransferase